MRGSLKMNRKYVCKCDCVNCLSPITHSPYWGRAPGNCKNSASAKDRVNSVCALCRLGYGNHGGSRRRNSTQSDVQSALHLPRILQCVLLCILLPERFQNIPQMTRIGSLSPPFRLLEHLRRLQDLLRRPLATWGALGGLLKPSGAGKKCS